MRLNSVRWYDIITTNRVIAHLGLHVERKVVYMEVVHNYEEWLELLDAAHNPEGFDELLGLYRTLNGDSGYGFKLEPMIHQPGWNWLTCPYRSMPALRLSDKAVGAMAKHIDAEFENGIESEEAFRHAMSKND